MKKRHLLSAIMCVVLSLAMSLTTYAQTYVGGGETRRVKQHEDFIQRIYNKGGLVFTYSHDITFHYDTNHVVTTRVEHGEDLVSYANTMATSQGINVSSYKPNSSACGSATWQLAGWKIGNDAANDADLLTTAPSNSNVDLYAVWKKDCTSTINWNGGSGSGGNLSGFAYYNNGNVTPFSCTLPTSAVRANYTFTDFSGYRAGQTVQLLDKSTFICNWKMNYKEEAIINQNPNWIDGGSIQCYGDFVVPANAAVIKLEWITNSNSFSYTRGYGLTCGVTPSFTEAQVVRGNSYFKGQIDGNQVYEGVWYVCTPGSVIVHNNPNCGTWNDLARLHIWYKY